MLLQPFKYSGCQRVGRGVVPRQRVPFPRMVPSHGYTHHIGAQRQIDRPGVPQGRRVHYRLRVVRGTVRVVRDLRVSTSRDLDRDARRESVSAESRVCAEHLGTVRVRVSDSVGDQVWRVALGGDYRRRGTLLGGSGGEDAW